MTSKIKIDLSRVLYTTNMGVIYPDIGDSRIYVAMIHDENGIKLTKEQFDNLNLELDTYRESLRPIDEKIRELQSQYKLPKEVWI